MLWEKLHYDLSFLENGKSWPCNDDDFRLNRYECQREQFELTPEDLIDRVIPTGLFMFKDYPEFVHFARILAYPRLLTLKTVDMVIGQPPSITAQANDEMTEVIKDLRSRSDLNSVIKQALIDYSRFGVFLVRIFKDENGESRACAWNPVEWVPVFYNDGTNRIKQNVIGWRHDEYLTVQIHETKDGSYEEREYLMDGNRTILGLKSTKKYNRNTKKRLLYAVPNTPTTTNPLGTSDYEIINALLQKAIERLQAILRVLDEHADPSMVGPHSLLEKDEHGNVVFKTNKYYAIGEDEQKPEYLVWEANLDSSFKAFEELCKQIYILSEMGEAFLGAPEGSGNVVSGTAMRFKMISPLEKARRITNELTKPIKEVISAMLAIENQELAITDINIAWKDSLPKDPREVAELTRLEAGAPAVKPLDKAIMDNYDLDKESAMAYVEQILCYLESFTEVTKKQDANMSGEDGRSHKPGANIDTRKKGSNMDPASSENRGEDDNLN